MSTAAAEPRAGVRPSRALRWAANPWGQPRFLLLFTLLYLVWSIVPILIAIRFSFNEGRSRSTAQGWSTRWYWGDPDLSVWHDPTLSHALVQSLKLAGLAILIAVPLGVALAIGLSRWRGRGSGAARFIALFPLVTPELAMGVALFLLFTTLFTWVELGTTAQLIGHVTFSISFVLLIVQGRLISIGKDYE
jgi:spermidine/putrescine transport system permease protein